MSVVLDWPGKAAAFALGRDLAADDPSPASRPTLHRRGANPATHGSAVDTGAGSHLGDGIGEVEPAVPYIPDPRENLLVVGDNLPALTALLGTHRGQVKVIYIDPPYNTGNALAYKDSGHDHASWLSFMAPRLLLARELLRPDGVLFLHLDDGESAWAQLLGHEVFGEENSLGTLIHQRAKGGGNSPSFVRGHDYVHVWGRDATQVGPFLTEKKAPAKLEIIDGKRMLVETDVLRAGFGRYARGSERRLMYEDILEVKGAKKLAEVDAKLASGRYILRPWGSAGKHAVVRVTPAEQASSKLYSIIKALGGQNDLDALGLGGMFSYPKPVALVEALITSQTFFDPEAIVLDFFAGSGTTAQAIMAANRRDGGSRSFVLVQTPEKMRVRAGASGRGTGAVQEASAEVAAESGSSAEVASPLSSSAEVAAGSMDEPATAVRSAPDPASFTRISELTAERIRRAAAELAPGLGFTELEVAELSSCTPAETVAEGAGIAEPRLATQAQPTVAPAPTD